MFRIKLFFSALIFSIKTLSVNLNCLVYSHVLHLIASVHLVFARYCCGSPSVLLKLVQTYHLGIFLNADSDSGGICISYKLPGDADAAGLHLNFTAKRLESRPLSFFSSDIFL